MVGDGVIVDVHVDDVVVVDGVHGAVVIEVVVDNVLLVLGVLILLSEWLICGCELVRSRC